MKKQYWKVMLAIVLITLSTVVYFIHYLIFRDLHHIFIYMIGDLAFVFVEVLLVTIIIHELLGIRERRLMLEKLNMIIGSFFSEVGKDLLKYFATVDPHAERIRHRLLVTDRWTTGEFLEMSKALKEYPHEIDLTRGDLAALKQLLVGKREFFLHLLENQSLLEHDSFTLLLMAVFHLTEELEARKDLLHIPEADRKHLTTDMKRVYSSLISEWLDYMKYLKDNYPYLFSFAMRTNPFDAEATPEVKG